MRFATIVAHSSPMPARKCRQTASIGVDSCHRIRYAMYFFHMVLFYQKTACGIETAAVFQFCEFTTSDGVVGSECRV